MPSTAFGLMFLTRATHKTLGRRHRRRKIGGGLLAGGRGLPKDLSTDHDRRRHGQTTKDDRSGG